MPTVELAQRLAEFDNLYATVLRSRQRLTPTRLQMVLDPQGRAAGAGSDLRESVCCSFFTFTFSQAADGLRLDVQVPVGYINVLDAVAAQASAVTAASSSRGASR